MVKIAVAAIVSVLALGLMVSVPAGELVSPIVAALKQRG